MKKTQAAPELINSLGRPLYHTSLFKRWNGTIPSRSLLNNHSRLRSDGYIEEARVAKSKPVIKHKVAVPTYQNAPFSSALNIKLPRD